MLIHTRSAGVECDCVPWMQKMLTRVVGSADTPACAYAFSVLASMDKFFTTIPGYGHVSSVNIMICISERCQRHSA